MNCYSQRSMLGRRGGCVGGGWRLQPHLGSEGA
ncbi:hypothetical protein HaLaN_05958 [Haematococcus lacustris]|uniref:Uncharacterized protein n=1 Tax=Haematococcus lacustris TaxID=44745 RepID=A0A699YUG1_HAELA|nr:hypothetical protein HaLaN_05958 [Haematococcus lacustris]